MTKDKKNLSKNNNLNTIHDGGFLQSVHWEKFQKSLGRKIVRVENEAASALLIEHQLPLVGSYFFAPRGPIFKITNNKYQITNKIQNSKSETFNEFINELIVQAQKENVGWVRVEPQGDEDLEMIKKSLGGKYLIKKSAKDHEPGQTVMVDLGKTEEEILAKMKPKTRYNIRLAEKKGVEIKIGGPKDIKAFYDLVEITSKRDGVASHPRSYYEKMVRSIDSSVLKLFLAKYGDKTIAGALASFYGGVATYLHGASSNEHRNVMAPHLLQWEIMKKARQLDCEKYDLGGAKIIENENNKRLHWDGITRFKTGFCPDCSPIVFPGCWDIVLNNFKYQTYRFLQKLKG